ncbi:hypothetical protein QTJ16_001081 [Diplocarpon rosae]|uniref:asparaginase n=1 Tax=Diplocarpon rosae TaxID=946125 RepID=A0AAD9T632_9HELO|nr:hypothetical protein QTJ16_001081 [Diplocarpon rosae]
MLTLAAFAVLAALAGASPFVAKETTEAPSFAYTNPNGLNFVQYNASLPNVAIFATGGTIAGSGTSTTQTSGYKAGVLGVMTLINSVPEILKVSNVAGVQIANAESSDIDSTILLSLSKKYVSTALPRTLSRLDGWSGGDAWDRHTRRDGFLPGCDGQLREAGRDRGAMRPATALSADGPFNLLEAVTVAGDPCSKNRGALVVLNDRIVSAYYVTKTNANTLDAFVAYEQGSLGSLVSNKPYYYYPPVSPTGKRAYDISSITAIPRVDILMAYEEMPVDLLQHSVDSGAKGIVIAGTGAGSVKSDFERAMQRIINSNTPVIQSTRATSGEVPNSNVARPGAFHIASGYLNPQKSRILLGLLLAQGKTLAEVANAFAPSTNN